MKIFEAYFLKGATAYEFQVGRYGARVVHMRGKFWAWRPWRRISFQKFPPEARN